jgi:hypothetical protein
MKGIDPKELLVGEEGWPEINEPEKQAGRC